MRTKRIHLGAAASTLSLTAVLLGGVQSAQAVSGYHTGFSSLIVRADSTRQSDRIDFISDAGVALDIACQTVGEAVTFRGYTSAIWDKLNGYHGGYISDQYVVETRFAEFDPRIPHCGDAPPDTPTSPDAGTAIVGLAGKCVDVRGARNANGTAVQLYDCNGTDAQHWTRNGDTLRAFGRCLDVAGGGRSRGTRVQLYDCNGTGAQNWQVADGALLNAQSSRCLDVSGGNPASGTPLQLWDCNQTAAQRWQLNAPLPPDQVVSAQMQAAADWATTQKNSSRPAWSDHFGHYWSGWCEQFAEQAEGFPGRFASAQTHYQWQRDHGRIHTDTNAPVGAVVFWDGPGGHVAISIGAGQAIGTYGGLGDRYAVRQYPLTGRLPNTYLGWARPINS